MMSISAGDIVPLTQARSNLSELADQVKAGAEKIITKNGESYVALIDARKLDYYHELEKERIHLILLEDARRALEQIAAGQGIDAETAMAQLRAARSARKAASQGSPSSNRQKRAGRGR
jgi:prevent-host-death family protein